MTEAEARVILEDICGSRADLGENLIRSEPGEGVNWTGADTAMLDGDFSAEELEAIAWWMRHMRAHKP